MFDLGGRNTKPIWVKLFLVLVIALVCFLSLFSNVSRGSLNVKNNFFRKNNETSIISITGLSGDLQIRQTGGSWQDNSLTADVGTTLEFKIDSSVTSKYVLLTVLVSLPLINDEAMFDYVDISARPIPGPLEGFFDASNTDVFWVWYMVDSSWAQEMIFKARITKSGIGTVGLYIVGIIDLDEGIYDEIYDSVEVTGESGCCFPAGTYITMADGSYKNIEDVEIGDRVLSYDPFGDSFSSWKVRLLGSPVHPLCSINNDLVMATVDHPFFVKKKDGRNGWGAVDLESAKKYVRLKGDGLSIEIGDSLFTSQGKWIRVSNIEYFSEPVQTYNILSFSGRNTYFANDVLVYEEYPPGLWVDYYFGKIISYMPHKFRNIFLPIFLNN